MLIHIHTQVLYLAFDLDVIYTVILPLNHEDETRMKLGFVFEKFIDNLLMAQYLTTDLHSSFMTDSRLCTLLLV